MVVFTPPLTGLPAGVTQIVRGEWLTDKPNYLSSAVFSEKWRDSESYLLPNNVLAVEARRLVVEMTDSVMMYVDHFAVVACSKLYLLNKLNKSACDMCCHKAAGKEVTLSDGRV